MRGEQVNVVVLCSHLGQLGARGASRSPRTARGLWHSLPCKRGCDMRHSLADATNLSPKVHFRRGCLIQGVVFL